MSRAQGQRLTWHVGSILPFASLWHTVHRAATLNALRNRELPFAVGTDGGGPWVRRADLLFNSPLASGQRIPGEALCIRTLAASLGESFAAFSWSHLGQLPQSCLCLFHPYLRLCPACLAGGYHSALYSLRPLESCPIHQCAFIERCPCGRRVDSEAVLSTSFSAGHCACGRMAYFTREICRRPAMGLEATQNLLPIAAWLQGMATVSRPIPSDAGVRLAHDAAFMSSMSKWCEALDISCPANLQFWLSAFKFATCETPLPRSSSTRTTLWSSGIHVPQKKANRKLHWGDSEATTVYRAMTRHLRRHVARGTEPFAVDFMANPNPLEMASKMRDSRKAMVAFAELLFCQCMERYAMLRRWPYRRPDDGMWTVRDCLDDARVEQDHEVVQSLVPEAKVWVKRQAGAAAVTHAWRRAQHTAIAAVHTGIADWRCSAGVYCFKSAHQADRGPPLNWYAASPPYQVTWATAKVGSHLRFVSGPVLARVDWDIPSPNKLLRVAAWRHGAAARRAHVSSACHGQCRTWNSREGWQILEAAQPGDGVVKKHRLLGVGSADSAFWIFVAGGRFVARSCEEEVQTFGQTPREAICNLRAAMRQHQSQLTLPMRARPRSARVEPCKSPRKSELEMQVMQCVWLHGFWRGAWEFNRVAIQHLKWTRPTSTP